MTTTFRIPAALVLLSLFSLQALSSEQDLQAQIDELRAMLVNVNSELRSVTSELDLLKQGVQTQHIDRSDSTDGNTAARSSPESSFLLGFSRDDITVKLNGYVRTDVIYDNERTGDDDSFVTALIPVKWKSSNGGDDQYHIGVDSSPFTSGKQTNMHARQTRFGIEASGDTPVGLFRTRFEGDFFGSNSNFRIRHAYGELGGWLVGKTWSNFGSLKTLPNTLDFEGPSSQMPSRNEQIRYRFSMADNWAWDFALEDSNYEPGNVDAESCGLVNCDANDFSNVYPDVISNLMFDDGANFLHLALAWSQLEIDATIDDGSSVFDRTYDVDGRGVVFGGRHLFGDSDQLQYQYTWVRGMGHLIADLAADDVAGNAVLVDEGRGVEELETLAGQIAWQHWWQPNWSSTLVYSQVVVENEDEQGPHAYHKSSYSSANLVWDVTHRVTTGVEYLYGVRTNNNGEKGRANRLQLMTRFSFD
ncbi:MAG: hypothetical protein CL693_01525 [Cellvibrionaceae bacterium]|nr:hypothetical protein [Cellvibrionaceae bacterium]